MSIPLLPPLRKMVRMPCQSTGFGIDFCWLTVFTSVSWLNLISNCSLIDNRADINRIANFVMVILVTNILVRKQGSVFAFVTFAVMVVPMEYLQPSTLSFTVRDAHNGGDYFGSSGLEMMTVSEVGDSNQSIKSLVRVWHIQKVRISTSKWLLSTMFQTITTAIITISVFFLRGMNCCQQPDSPPIEGSE